MFNQKKITVSELLIPKKCVPIFCFIFSCRCRVCQPFVRNPPTPLLNDDSSSPNRPTVERGALVPRHLSRCLFIYSFVFFNCVLFRVECSRSPLPSVLRHHGEMTIQRRRTDRRPSEVPRFRSTFSPTVLTVCYLE